MDTSQMMEAFQALLRQTQEQHKSERPRGWRDKEKRRQEAEEAEEWHDEKLHTGKIKGEERQEALLLEERKREIEDIKALIQDQKQIQEHTAAKLRLLRGCLLYTSNNFIKLKSLTSFWFSHLSALRATIIYSLR